MATATAPSRRSAERRPEPFTVEHFKRYVSRLVLDNGDRWPIGDDPWMLEVIADIFSGFREVWLLVPEGNSKTTLMAALGLYHTDFTPSPWVPIGAASRDQAEILFGQAAGFVERTPGLDVKQYPEGRFKVYEGYRKIMSTVNGGRGLKVYAADKATGDGVIPTLCLVDEPHRHKDLGLYRTWKGKLRKRRGQIVALSTAGEPGTDFEETRDAIRDAATERDYITDCHLRAVGNGVVMHEFRVPDARLARDLEVVKRANPLSVITMTDLREKLESPTLDFGEDWLRLTCNIPARSSQAAITDAEWDNAADGEIPVGDPVDVGLDIAWKHDTTAFVPLWMPARDRRVLGDPEVLIPPRDGTMLEPQELRDAFDRVNERNPVRTVVMDREKGEEFAEWLENDRGVTVVIRGKTAEPASQDYEAFMEGLREGSLRHTGHKDLRRHAMNAVARKLPNDRRRFDRPSSSRATTRQDTRVIDALDAAAMVHCVAVANFRAPGRSRALVFH